MRHSKHCATSVTVALGVYGGDVIESTLKQPNFVADSTIPETVVPRTLSQAPVILDHRIRHLSVPLRYQSKAACASDKRVRHPESSAVSVAAALEV